MATQRILLEIVVDDATESDPVQSVTANGYPVKQTHCYHYAPPMTERTWEITDDGSGENTMSLKGFQLILVESFI